MHLSARLRHHMSRAWSGLDSATAARMAMLVMPLLFGLLSLRLGQDDNWDLKNYHLYNPFAFLNGKIGFDLAPAQWQSYFNPTLDLLYYGLNKAFAAPVVGFSMGFLHGLNFLLVAAIARQVKPAAAGNGYRTPLLLALAGTLGTGFLAQLGNSMGDNMTSLFVLGALLCILRGWDTMAAGGRHALLSALPAGLLMGLGCGLKLTNATYALALCIALLAVPGAVAMRCGIALVFGFGVLGGIAISAGHWFALMYHTFGNPLFPQFNDFFHAPMAAPIGIGDTGWLPKNLFEKLSWPLIFAIHPRRVGELPLRLWLWPVLYVAMLMLALKIIGLFKHATASPPVGRERFVLFFFALTYLAWLNLFGIYRYLVPLELLLPLVLWMVASRLLPSPLAARVATAILIVGIVAGLPRASWGHAPWSRTAFSAELPVITEPRESMIVTVHGDPPMGWLVTRFPATLAFVALESGFPESPMFVDTVKHMAAARKGPMYVMLQSDRTDPTAARSPMQVEQAQAANQALLTRAAMVVSHYGFAMDAASCKAYPAFVGKSRWNYQLCMIRKQ